MEKFESVALLVDGDNIQANFADQIITKTATLGDTRVRRTFCNQSSLSDWSAASSFQSIYAGDKENGSDILLSIHAMRLALEQKVEAFAIASHDRDFSHVAHALRELGHHVVGIGTNTIGKDFRYACSQFIELDRPVAKVAATELDSVDQALRRIIDENDPDGRGILMSNINPLIRKHMPDFKISKQEEKNWPTYFEKWPKLYTIIGKAKDRRVMITHLSD